MVDKANLKNYKITMVFNIESDKLPSEPIEKAEGEELWYNGVPDTLKAADGKFYAFDGWYWDEDYEDPITKDPVITKDMTIYGLYEVIETCTVTVDYNGHGGNEVRKITGVPKGTFADYPVLLALAGAEIFSWEAYDAVEDLIYEKGLEAIAPTEDGYALNVYFEQYNEEYVAYGLKKTYDSWDDFHDEFDERVNVFEDTTFYLQWSKIVDSVEIVCSEPLVCGAEKGSYIDCLSAAKDSGCTLEVTDESGNFNDNKYVGGYNYGYEAEINANYGYVLDKNAAAWSADVMIDGLIFMGPISPINPDTGSYPYTSAIETYFYVRCEHKWGEPQDVSAEEAAQQGLTSTVEGRTWQKITCTVCGNTIYVEKAAENETTYKVTVKADGQKDIVIENVLSGTDVNALLNERVTTSNELYHLLYDRYYHLLYDRYNLNNLFVGITTKPTSEYKTTAELEADIEAFANGGVRVTDKDVTVYAHRLKKITPEVIFNSVPKCMDSTFDENGIAVLPDISLPKDAHYSIDVGVNPATNEEKEMYRWSLSNNDLTKLQS